MEKEKGKYQMLDNNLNNNVKNSRAQGLDINDDEVEIDLLEIFYALKKKILLVLMVALAGACIAAAKAGYPPSGFPFRFLSLVQQTNRVNARAAVRNLFDPSVIYADEPRING